MVEILNNQNKIILSINTFKNFAERILNLLSINKAATIVFVSDDEIKNLNKQFRRKNTTTDVLSFPYESDDFGVDENQLGDIVISAEQARRQALENDLNLELEIKQLILHGILHLCGFDHETDNGEMNELELKLRDKLDIS